MITLYSGVTMANQLGKGNSSLGKIHAGKIRINDMSFLDPITLQSSYFVTYTRSINDNLALSSDIEYLNTHEQTIADFLDIQEILIYDTDFIFSRVIADNLTINQAFNLQSIFDRTFSDQLNLTEHIVNNRINIIDQSLSLNQIIADQYVHQRYYNNRLTFNETISSEIRHLWIHVTDKIHYNQSAFINTPKFILTSKSGEVFVLPQPNYYIYEDLDFEGSFKIMDRKIFTFDIPLERLKDFKSFMNYYRFDPFTISDTVNTYLAYLHHSKDNRQALDMFNTETTVSLDFHLLTLN